MALSLSPPVLMTDEQIAEADEVAFNQPLMFAIIVKKLDSSQQNLLCLIRVQEQQTNPLVVGQPDCF